MELKINDIMSLLKKSEKEIVQLIKDGRIPHYRINGQYQFNKAEISDWVLSNNIPMSGEVISLFRSGHQVNLSQLLEVGGIHANIEGGNLSKTLRHAVSKLVLPTDITQDELLAHLLAREHLKPTAIGRGIAIPHPRTPIITDPENEMVAICYLNSPVEYEAFDREPVNTLFIPISATPRRHLEILAKISRLCQEEDFIGLLKSQTPSEPLLDYISRCESQWERRV